jgi:hypothetical protein
MIGAVVELPALMYVSEVTLGPRTITPVTEATNARKSVAFSDLIASKPVACVGAFTFSYSTRSRRA